MWRAGSARGKSRRVSVARCDRRQGMDVAARGAVHPAIERLQRRGAADERVIALASGLPSPSTFPRKGMNRAIAMALRDPAALQYGWPEGRLELRRWVSARLRSRGIDVGPDEVTITSGAQQALDIAMHVATSEGDTIAVGHTSYPAALELFAERGRRAVRDLSHARATYTMPAIANPGGNAMSDAERTRILESGTVIFEDDAYAELRFDGRVATPLRALAPDRVYSIGTLSKTLVPGLRVGWLVTPPDRLREARRVKAVADLQANSLAQAVLEQLFERLDFDARLEKLRVFYRRRAERLAQRLRAELPSFRFREPEGGFSLWIETDEPGDDADLLATALRHGVSFDAGRDFRRSGQSSPIAMRLAFSSIRYEDIDEAVRRLARAWKAWKQTPVPRRRKASGEGTPREASRSASGTIASGARARASARARYRLTR
jgi:2-aminoadipate transaminase